MIQVKVSDKQEILGLNKEQRDKIKNALTFDNPKYKDVLKYSKYKYTKVPPKLYFYSTKTVDGEIVLVVPRGFNVLDYIDKASYTYDFNVEKVSYPPFLLNLRGDQKEASRKYLSENIHNDYPKSVIQLPTGKGKTILALYLASTLEAKTLVLVHKDDLVVGWQKDIKSCFGEEFKSGLIKAKKKEIGEQITIATVQTINRMSLEDRENLFRSFSLVIQDELHHLNYSMFGIIDNFNAQYRLGLTATPFRSDGMNYLFDLYTGGLCYRYEYKENDEDICGVKVIIKDSKAKYRPFIEDGRVFNYYDFLPSQLPDNITFVENMMGERPKIPFFEIDSNVVLNHFRMKEICKDLLNEYKHGRSCLVLFSQKEHIRKYRDYLTNFIPEDTILLYYGDSTEKTDEMLEKAENRECLITLATYSKATEGTNVKSWEVLFLASSLNNEKNVEQATGRIRRRKEGKLEKVLVYDYRLKDVYSMRSHLKTRMRVYDKLKYEIENHGVEEKKSVFSRGYFSV